MAKSVIKHNKWIVFYTLMIVAFFLFAFVSIGIIKLKIPRLPFETNSPDFAVSEVKILCGLDKYKDVAVRSVKFIDGRYVLISESDLQAGTTEATGYLVAAEGLCNAFDYSRKETRVRISDSEWEFKYSFGLVFDSSRLYKVVYFDGDWRFVLEK